MTNKQLASARRTMRQFSTLDIMKQGETLTPYRVDDPSIMGSPLIVTDAMQEADVRDALQARCEAILG